MKKRGEPSSHHSQSGRTYRGDPLTPSMVAELSLSLMATDDDDDDADDADDGDFSTKD